MWNNLISWLCLAAQPRHDNDNDEGYRKLIPIAILAVFWLLSAVSKILNKKKAPAKSAPRPSATAQSPSTTPPAAPQKNLPLYARGRATSPPGQQPARPQPIPTAAQSRPIPMKKPVPAAQPARATTPTRTITSRPAQKPAPVSPTTRRVAPQKVQTPLPKAAEPAVVETRRQTAVAKPRLQPGKTAAGQLEKLTEKVKQDYAGAQYHSSQTPTSSPVESAYPSTMTPMKLLETALSQHHELARAVIYSEIIGPPMALKTQFGHEWL
jgi:ribonuclease E